jgi:Phytanoyl-CoA dioxygenase (PhyH)
MPEDTGTAKLLRGKLYPSVFRSEAANKKWITFVWLNLYNWFARLRFLASRTEQRVERSEVAKRLLSDLRKRGVAITDVDEIGAQQELAELRAKYRVEPSGLPLEGLRTGEPLVHALSRNAVIKDTVDAYCGLATSSQQAGCILHPSVRQETRRGNAKWHVDIEDLHVVKAFLFLTDVEEDSGPTEFVPGTHPDGEHALELAGELKRGIPLDAEKPLGLAPERLVGKAGTVALFDARALHRGGFGGGKWRAVAFSSFTAPNWVHPQLGFSLYIALKFRVYAPLARALSPWNLLLAPFRYKVSSDAYHD